MQVIKGGRFTCLHVLDPPVWWSVPLEPLWVGIWCQAQPTTAYHSLQTRQLCLNCRRIKVLGGKERDTLNCSHE